MDEMTPGMGVPGSAAERAAIFGVTDSVEDKIVYK